MSKCTYLTAIMMALPQFLPALAISPVDLEIMTKRPQGYYSIINDGNSEKTIAIYGGTRDVNAYGEEEIGETNDLVIYPKLVVLKPNEKRVVRVIWKAKEKLRCEKAYRIVFEEQNFQIPTTEADLEDEGRQIAGIALGIKFVGTIYIQPHNKLRSKLSLVDYKIVQEAEQQMLQVCVENSGTRRMYLDPSALEVELKKDASDAYWTPISEEKIRNSLRKGSTLLAGHKKILFFPLDEELPKEISSLRVTE